MQLHIVYAPGALQASIMRHEGEDELVGLRSLITETRDTTE
jgi:hypothetical protein